MIGIRTVFFRERVVACILPVCILLVSCNREKRIAEVSASAATTTTQEKDIPLQPGGLGAGEKMVPPLKDRSRNPFEGNYDAMNNGKRLFSWYNCAGCHSSGGGGAIGPPLIDAKWIYGNSPGDIYETLIKGRKNGMPAFGGKIPDYQVWQLVTYVRSLSHEAAAPQQKQQ
ncbi:MAG TPA: c-type cytochrome [Bryobacteraceae bacterium]|nr:c-type cytochrome [Bryobacteraceae bacterium]